MPDPVFADAKKYEDALWDQKRNLESLPPKHRAVKQLAQTAELSKRCAHAQSALENAYGKPQWPTVKGAALGAVRDAQQVVADNVALGVGGWNWTTQQPEPVPAFRAKHGV